MLNSSIGEQKYISKYWIDRAQNIFYIFVSSYLKYEILATLYQSIPGKNYKLHFNTRHGSSLLAGCVNVFKAP